jgi:hypothetical protein
MKECELCKLFKDTIESIKVDIGKYTSPETNPFLSYIEDLRSKYDLSRFDEFWNGSVNGKKEFDRLTSDSSKKEELRGLMFLYAANSIQSMEMYIASTTESEENREVVEVLIEFVSSMIEIAKLEEQEMMSGDEKNKVENKL